MLANRLYTTHFILETTGVDEEDHQHCRITLMD